IFLKTGTTPMAFGVMETVVLSVKPRPKTVVLLGLTILILARISKRELEHREIESLLLAHRHVRLAAALELLQARSRHRSPLRQTRTTETKKLISQSQKAVV